MGKIFSQKLFKNKMALSKNQPRWHATDRRFTCVVGRGAVSRGKLFSFKLDLTFSLRCPRSSWIHARNRRDLTSHVFVGNNSLRRRPRGGSWHVQPLMQTTGSSTVWQGHQPSCSCRRWLDKPGLCCVHTAKLSCVHMQHGKKWVWS